MTPLTSRFMIKYRTMKQILALIALFGSFAYAAEVVDVQIKAIDRFGGDLSSVMSRCQTKIGSKYDPVTVSRDVTALRDSGEFEDISVDASESAEGVRVTFSVRRKTRFHAPLVVNGASFFSESRILKESGLQDGYLYSAGELAAGAAKVRTLYQKKGFGDVKIGVKVVSISANDCKLQFNVEEGVRRQIDKYLFPGAKAVELAELREAIGVLPWWNPMGWFNDEPVTDEQLAQCVAKIEELYRNRGYLDVVVSNADFDDSASKPGRYNVCFTVTENACFKVGKTRIDGLTRYSEDDVRAKSAVPAAGAVASQSFLDECARSIEIAVGSGDLGLAGTRVEVRCVPSSAAPDVVDVDFVVTEGVPVVIRNIRVTGNDYTKDKVIRREIQLGPGDRMLEDRAERGKKRLQNLDYFSRVDYSLKPTGEGKDENGFEKRDLVYEVEEKNTGSFMVGVGASSVDSVYVSAEVSQSNFDIFAPDKWFRGAGQKGRIYAAVGPRIQSYEASVTEPWFLDRQLELTVEAYRRNRWYDEYDVIRTGADASLSYPVKFWPTWEPFGRFGVRLGAEYIEMDDVEREYLTYGNKTGYLLQEEEREFGEATECVARFFWTRNKTDNFRMPTRGSRSNVYVDFAGGDNEYYRAGFNHRNYFTVWDRYNHVFMLAFRGETIEAFSGEVPIYNRMFLGGPKSIRGIEYRNVAPMASRVYGDSVPWGGQTLFCMNAEYTIPIVKMLRFAVFSDFGGVAEDSLDFDFSDTLAWTIGCGFRIDIAMFPIRLDFATPIKKPDEAEEEVFSFTIGYDF